MKQPVNRNNQSNIDKSKVFEMIDNYIYLYHTDTLIALPLYPESIEDSTNVTFASEHPMGRSAPIFSYSNSGPRSFQVQLPLHRDMMNEINNPTRNPMFRDKIKALSDENADYLDIMVKQLQSAALPSYAASEKMINPPRVAVRFGNSIFCKGVINGPVSVVHSGPILAYPDGSEKYALITVSFAIYETDPYDAYTVQKLGGFRKLSTTLER